MSEELAILRSARELLSDRDRWCQNASARDINGESVPAASDKAVRWCAFGAVLLFTWKRSKAGSIRDETNTARMVMCRLDEAGPILDDCTAPGGETIQIGVTTTNDERGYEAVMAMFDSAIAKEEARNVGTGGEEGRSVGGVAGETGGGEDPQT